MKSILAGFLCGILLFAVIHSSKDEHTPKHASQIPPSSELVKPSSISVPTPASTPLPLSKEAEAENFERLQRELMEADTFRESIAKDLDRRRPLRKALHDTFVARYDTTTQLRYRKMRELEDWYNQHAFTIDEFRTEQREILSPALLFTACSSFEPVGEDTLGQAARVVLSEPSRLSEYRSGFAKSVREYLNDPSLADQISSTSDLDQLVALAHTTVPRMRQKFRERSSSLQAQWGEVFDAELNATQWSVVESPYSYPTDYSAAWRRLSDAQYRLDKAIEDSAMREFSEQ